MNLRNLISNTRPARCLTPTINPCAPRSKRRRLQSWRRSRGWSRLQGRGLKLVSTGILCCSVNDRVMMTMRCDHRTLGAAVFIFAEAESDRASLCVAPNSDESVVRCAPGLCGSGKISFKVDDQPVLPWPKVESTKISGLDAVAKHCIAQRKFAASFATIQESGRAPRPGNVARPHHAEPPRSCDPTDGWIFMVLDWRSQGL